ncbi:MAG: T9SS type A sorting domain-containing protein [Bacteroidota bacterium]
MKKSIIILVLLISSCQFSYSQSNVYHPFPESDAIWVGTYWYLVGGSFPIVEDDYNLYIGGDTTIGAYIYHKLYQNGFVWTTGHPGYYYYGRYAGSFRQDFVNRKVYLFENGTDTLAYDFNLNTGDTLPVSCLSVGITYTVQSIDSVLIGSQYHKRFRLDNYIALMEGIGTTLGAFAHIAPAFESGNDLWCLRINNQIAWTSSQGNECRLTSINENPLPENRLIISPNPFSLSTTLKTNQTLINATLAIYDSYGQHVKEIKSISGQTFKLQRDNLPDGLYFMRLSQDGKTIITDKLIITD